MVRLRLARGGRHKRPFYRVVAADSRMPRDGRFLEVVGIYDPLKEPPTPELKQERVLDWLSKGAQPSVTVRTLLRRSGVWAQFMNSKTQRQPVHVDADPEKRAGAPGSPTLND